MILILSGPSGVGKSFTCDYFTSRSNFIHPIAYTTRQKRLGEIDGESYHFVDLDTAKQISNCFANGYWANPIGDTWYGYTDELDAIISNNENIILIMEVELARRFKRKYCNAICIMLNYVSLSIMRERVKERTNSKEEYDKRLLYSMQEKNKGKDYDYILYSDNPNDFINQINEIIKERNEQIFQTSNSDSSI